MKKLLTTIFILITIIFYSCDTTDPPPPPDDNTTLDFTWTVDTLKNPNGYGVVPLSIWGSSPQDVWIAGYNLAWQAELFHWNENKWNRVTPDLGFNYSLTSVYGFSEHDIYATGYKIIIDTALHSESLILHYNGNIWQQESIPKKGGALNYIHGGNENDIWACGRDGTLYHKTGNSWEKIIFDEKLNLGPIYVEPGGNVFMMSFPSINPPPGDSARHYFWKYSNQKWQIIDSNTIHNNDYRLVGFTFGNKSMWGVNENEIYSAGYAVYKFDGNTWQAVVWDDYPYNDIKGTSGNKIFAVGNHGTIRYYHANNWLRIPDFSGKIVDFYSVMPFEDEIFIGAYQLGIGYVVRGKLKK